MYDSSPICDKINGSCIHGCRGNTTWGTHCQNNCSPNCLNETCDQMTGKCTAGCRNNRFYDDECTLRCNSNCLNGTCNKNGICIAGCIDGWHGDMCDRQCNENCFENRCNQTGTCLNKCKPGWYGKHCTHQCCHSCINGECVETTGNCSHGNPLSYNGPVFGGGNFFEKLFILIECFILSVQLYKR